jgi:hypothetical protein
MRHGRYFGGWGAVAALGAIILGLVPTGLATAQPATPVPAATAPARWELTGDDARRVEEWEQTTAKLVETGQFTAALASARSILELRTRVQGADHWRTAEARWELRRLEQVVRKPPADRAELAHAVQLQSLGADLFQRGRYAEAVALLRTAL